MPITEFQRRVLALLKSHRNPNSYIAGGIAIHRADSSIRYSNDIDFFHDTDEAVGSAVTADTDVLKNNGYEVRLLIDRPGFARAVVIRGDSSLKLEWVRDTAFRFFPVMEDAALGYRLHDVDLAINKCLTLANRTEIRDIIDLIQLHSAVLTFPATCWAACGKDPGFTPELLLDCIRRHSIFRSEQLAAESLTHAPTLPDLKREWLEILDPAADILWKFPAADIGCLYLNSDGSVVASPVPGKTTGYKRHLGSIGGSWPSLVP